MHRRKYLSTTAIIASLGLAGCFSSESVALEYQAPDEYLVDLEFHSGTTLDPPAITVSPGARLAHFTDHLLLLNANEQVEWTAIDEESAEFALE